MVEKMSWKMERGGFRCSAQGQAAVAGSRLGQPLPALKSFSVLALWERGGWNFIYRAHICIAV